jgi:hypothetical protein
MKMGQCLILCCEEGYIPNVGDVAGTERNRVLVEGVGKEQYLGYKSGSAAEKWRVTLVWRYAVRNRSV